jgi:hypothetical protein
MIDYSYSEFESDMDDRRVYHSKRERLMRKIAKQRKKREKRKISNKIEKKE